MLANVKSILFQESARISLPIC